MVGGSDRHFGYIESETRYIKRQSRRTVLESYLLSINIIPYILIYVISKSLALANPLALSTQSKLKRLFIWA